MVPIHEHKKLDRDDAHPDYSWLSDASPGRILRGRHLLLDRRLPHYDWHD